MISQPEPASPASPPPCPPPRLWPLRDYFAGGSVVFPCFPALDFPFRGLDALARLQAAASMGPITERTSPRRSAANLHFSSAACLLPFWTWRATSSHLPALLATRILGMCPFLAWGVQCRVESLGSNPRGMRGQANSSTITRK